SLAQRTPHTRHLHSFPTRRSSDLLERVAPDDLELLLEVLDPVRGDHRPVLAVQRKARRGDAAAGEVAGRELPGRDVEHLVVGERDRKSTRLNSSHVKISYAVFCLK